MMSKRSGLWLAVVWSLFMTASQWLHSFCRQTGLFVFPAQNGLLLFAKKALLFYFFFAYASNTYFTLTLVSDILKQYYYLIII